MPNESEKRPKPITEDAFIEEIKKELAGAVRMTPFLGSGVSAQSGIIMGEEFPKYLAWTVSQVLQKKWDVRKRGWPPFPSSDEKEKSHNYLLEQFINWCNARKIDPSYSHDEDFKKVTGLRVPRALNHQQQIGARDVHLMRPLVPEILRGGLMWEQEDFLDTAKRNLNVKDEPGELNTPDSSEEYIIEVALRALSHWTRTLEFLARICLTTSTPPRLYLDKEPDISVIDGFNAHITRGKRPNLIHNMISRLARSMRTQVVLTTNFDTLIEQSYRAQGEPLHMLAVSIKGGLPSFATVRAQDCVLKLHGDILETRADTSINEPPSSEDKIRFFQYLRGPGLPHQRQPDDFVPSHLLVLGYSAGDPRCVQMIRYTLDMDSGFKLFWVCHTVRDVERVQKLFGAYGERVRIVRTDRTDLLLWELYQKLNLSLPGGGYSLQFTHQVPPRSALFEKPVQGYEEAVDKLYKLIVQKSDRKVVYVDCGSGTTQPLQAVFRLFKKNHYQAAWFELEDYRNTDDLYFNLLSLISLNLGYFQLEWINFTPRRDANRRMDNESRKLRLRLLIEKFKIKPMQWVLFLYGRNGPGGCTGWNEEGNYWGKDELQNLDELLIFLSALGFKIIYLPRGKNRNVRDAEMKTAFEEHMRCLFPGQEPPKLQLPSQISKPNDQMEELTETLEMETAKKMWHSETEEDHPGTTPKFISILKSVIHDFGVPTASDAASTKSKAQKSARAMWLYGLTLMRQSRHPAAMISEAIFPCPWRFRYNEPEDLCSKDNDEFRHRLICESDPELPGGMGWMPYLQFKGLFLRKPGGYSWMYRDTRLGLQAYYEAAGKIELYSSPFSGNPSKICTLKSLKCIRARLHYWIGDWYLRAYYSTGHFIPLIEAIYHSVQAIHHSTEYHWVSESENSDDQVSMIWRAVCQFRKLLLVGRRSLLFWCPGVDIKQCFFENDITIISNAIKEVTRKANPSSKAICDKLKQLSGHVLESEVNHLHEAVLKEAFAHGGRTSPILGGTFIHGGSCEYVTPPDQAWKEIEPPTLNANPAKDWKENIVKKMIKISGSLTKVDRHKPGVKIMSKHVVKRLVQSIMDEGGQQKLGSTQELRRKWLKNWSAYSGDEARLFHMIWLLSELMYRILRRAKLEYHHQSITRQMDKPTDALLMSGAETGVVKYWKIVSALGYQALQMCRSLSPDYHHAECDLRVRILTLYAVSLGYLNRFSEANRRFNEAHAIILSGMGWPDGKELARIHIRRAEVLIWRARVQAKDVLKKDFSLERAKMAIAWLDDAWAALERGEICMGGVSHSTYWWYRLLSQKLSCYAVLGTLFSQLETNEAKKDNGFDLQSSCLPFRRRIHLPTTLLGLMRDALIVGAGDLFRQLRVLEYTMIADSALNLADERIFTKADPTSSLFSKNTHPELYRDVLRVLEYHEPTEPNLKLGTHMSTYLQKVRELWFAHTGVALHNPMGL